MGHRQLVSRSGGSIAGFAGARIGHGCNASLCWRLAGTGGLGLTGQDVGSTGHAIDWSVCGNAQCCAAVWLALDLGLCGYLSGLKVPRLGTFG